MNALKTVVVADFLEETGIESACLEGVAKLVVAGVNHEKDLVPFLAEADGLILFHEIPSFGELAFANAPRCKVLVRAGVGYNNVDLKAADAHGVIVCNVPDYGTEEVADHAIMMLLAAARQLIQCNDAIRANHWHYETAIRTPRLRGKTLGIIGCGRIGSATALRAKSFGLDVLFYDPYAPEGTEKALGIRRTYDLDDLLASSHFVSLHCYLDAGTHHLINAKTIAKMRPGAIFVNTARGGVVDQLALLEAVESGHIAAAALDVLEREPLDDERLRNHPNIMFTPHSAFYSIEGFTELRTKTAQEVRRVLLGERPRNCVNQAGK